MRCSRSKHSKTCFAIYEDISTAAQYKLNHVPYILSPHYSCTDREFYTRNRYLPQEKNWSCSYRRCAWVPWYNTE